MPVSRETTPKAALSGGNNLATALSLNACPYRATEILHRRPLIGEFYWHDNYSDAAGIVSRLHWLHDRVRLDSGIIAAVHGKLTSCDEVRAWHRSFHQRLLTFFTDQLTSAGVPKARARTIVQTSLLIFEGLAVLNVSDAHADEVFSFIAEATATAVSNT